MNLRKILTILLFTSMVSSCGFGGNESNVGGNAENYPKSVEDKLKEGRGKITGEDGITLVGGAVDMRKHGGGEIISRGVNAYLWQASLDTISFMPIASVDATGGVIITDWYEDPGAKGERLKANIVISSDELRASGIKVSLFRQAGGQAVPANPELSRKLEDKILTRARELKIEDERF